MAVPDVTLRLRRRKSYIRRAIAVFVFIIASVLFYRMTHPSRHTRLPVEFSAPTPRFHALRNWFADQDLEHKYFHEPGGSTRLRHFDQRFFNHSVGTQERAYILPNMVRAYLDFFRRQGMETWIAHGTLLGWWWNGRILPWDWDVDTQVATSTLQYLADHYNQTVVKYIPKGQGKENARQYLLDVNHYARRRDRGNGRNVIDARFIDMQTGMYIDITGLSELNPSHEPGVLSCKNFHKYRTSELYPLRSTVFEGVRAFVPYRYEQILTEEYDSGLTNIRFRGHDWHQSSGKWIPQMK